MQAMMRPYVFAAFLAGALVLVIVMLKPFFAPLILAAVFAVVFQPVYSRILRTLRGYESIASLFTVLLALAIVLGVIGGIATQIALEATDLYGSLATRNGGSLVVTLPEAVASLMHQYAPSAPTSLDLTPYFEGGLSWLLDNLDTIFSSISKTLLDLFIFVIALYYLLKDGWRLAARFVAASPLADRDDREILGRLHMAVNSVLRGSLAVALIQGTLTGIGFMLFDVPNPVLWGTTAAIAALVPGLGTALITAPAVVFLLLNGDTGSAIGLAAWGSAAVGMVDNLLGPRLMGAGMRMHPLLMLLSVLGGLSFFGPIGFLVGPLSVSLFLALLDIYTEESRARQNQ